MLKEKPANFIEIEEDYDAETDALRFSDNDHQYADSSSSDNDIDEFEVQPYTISIIIYVALCSLSYHRGLHIIRDPVHITAVTIQQVQSSLAVLLCRFV